MSTLVRTPTVLSPFGSTFWAAQSASAVARSALAAQTARIIALGREMYRFTHSSICYTILGSWSYAAFLTSPGRSTRVSGMTYGENILSPIGLGETALLLPVPRSVSATISWVISSKLMNFLSPLCWNSPHSYYSLPFLSLTVWPGLVVFNCRINGLLVTIPEPRGNMSLPHIASRTEDLPADWDPTTTICGKSTAY